jgi:hypothetical protein
MPRAVCRGGRAIGKSKGTLTIELVQNFSALKEFLIKSLVIAPHVDSRGLEYS